MVISFFTPLCKASSKPKVQQSLPFAALDSVMRVEITDSIAYIIQNAKKIEVSILKKEGEGAYAKSETVRCNKENIGAFKFAMVASSYAKNDAISYSPFIPYVQIDFYAKKSSCSALIDLGSMQMHIVDSHKGECCSLRLYDNLLIKASVMAFPNDEFINFILRQK